MRAPTPTARSPLIAIVGRPNVGKSTLFNRLLGSRRSVVSAIRGTTRDRVYGETEWRGLLLRLVDTGGLDAASQDSLITAVQRHVLRAVEEATAVILLCNVQDGLIPADELIMERLRESGKPVVVAVNKIDYRLTVPSEFFSLGVPEIIPISALHGRGIGELLDRLIPTETPPTMPAQAVQERLPAIAIVGRQNVGKSSLLNALLREERVIVSELPGTTRDAIDSRLDVDGISVRLIDTAGLRHRRKVKSPVDFFAMGRSLDAIERCDVALVVLDATHGVTHDDQRIVTRVCDAGRGLVLLVNKWDLLKGGNERALTAAVHRKLPFAVFAPVLAVSAKTGFQVKRCVQRALQVFHAVERGLPDHELNALLERTWMARQIPRYRGRPIRLHRACWIPGHPPRVELVTNGRVPEPFQRTLLKVLHAHRKLAGVPIRLAMKGS